MYCQGALNTAMVGGAVYKGDLLVALKYVPGGSPSSDKESDHYGELQILVKGAKNLSPSRSSGTVDSFVKM